MTAAIGHHGAIKCAIDIALHDLAGKRLGLPVRELIGLPGELPPTDFTLGIDAPAVVAERAARAADFPALKIKVGGPSDVETLEAVRAVYGGPIRVDANTGWTPEGAAGAPARARAPRRGAHRAAVPGAPPRPAPLAPGAHRAADRRRRERGHDRGPRRARGRHRRRQRQARQVRRPRPGAADAGAGPRRSASGRSSAAWRRPRSGSRPRRPSRRSRSGWTSTAACCSPTTPPRASDIGPDKRWILADRPGLGLTLRADSRP